MEPPTGFEPVTYALQVRCSSQTELRRQYVNGIDLGVTQPRSVRARFQAALISSEQRLQYG